MTWIIIKNGWALFNNKKWRGIKHSFIKDAHLRNYRHLIIQRLDWLKWKRVLMKMGTEGSQSVDRDELQLLCAIISATSKLSH